LSGQTLEIINLTEQVATFKVGLLGIEAPVRGQDPWYGQSKAWLESAFAADKSIQLEADLQTQWVNCSRSVSRFAYVWQGNVLLNEKLIETGHALVGQSVSTLKYRQRLIRAQEKARLAGVGIWNPQQPLRERPSEFCQQNSSKT
jgi:micrococcal nuclease